MQNRSNLQLLRRRYHITLAELGTASGFSNQYISRAELGQIQPTKRLEEQLESAVERIIVKRESTLRSFKRDFQSYKGRLLRPVEDTKHDE